MNLEHTKTWLELEDIIICPVCLIVPKSNVRIQQCINGHHICHDCYKQLQKCPLCQGDFIHTRNLFAESTFRIIENLQASIDTYIKSVEDKCVQDICNYEKELSNRQVETISTQTDNEPVMKTCNSSSTQTFSNQRENDCENLGKTRNRQNTDFFKLPCLIGTCMAHMPYVGLLKHLRQCHKNIFYEVYQDEFCNKFTVDTAKLPIIYDYAIRISTAGLFFFNMMLHDSGEFVASIQLVNNNVTMTAFHCELELKNRYNQLHRTMQITSCFRNKNLVNMHTFQINKEEICKMRRENSFQCTLKIRLISKDSETW